MLALDLRALLSGSAPLQGDGVADEVERRLLSVSRKMLAAAAQSSWPAPDASAENSGQLTPEAFDWDQVSFRQSFRRFHYYVPCSHSNSTLSQAIQGAAFGLSEGLQAVEVQ